MPAFTAINLEPEDSADEQIDTTKELHVEEALKHFQTALRLHAQGPRSRDAAAAAYNELFDCEIFKYREAGTDYDRTERYDKGELDPFPEVFSSGLGVDAGGADGVAANLALALYLAYKNHGQFFLDKLKDIAESDAGWKAKARVLYRQDGGDHIVDKWVSALDQDPSDPEVWRKLARFVASMGSARLKRFCLEAAIELDDDPTVAEVEIPSLAEGMAGEELKDQLKVLGDDMALTHPSMVPWRKRKMPTLIKRHIDPIPFLPDPTQTLTPPASSPAEEEKMLEDADGDVALEDNEDEIGPITSWSTLGQELKKCVEDTERALRVCKSILANSSLTIETQVQPSISVADEATQEDKVMEEAEPVKQPEPKEKLDETTESPTALEKPAKEVSQPLITRKRSQSVAGIPDGGEEEVAEKRSKRVRRRETEENANPSAILASQLLPYQEIDHHLFQITRNILENLGVEDRATLECIGEIQKSAHTEDRMSTITPLAAKDLRTVVSAFTENTVKPLLNKQEQATLGLSSFLEHTKPSSTDQLSLPSFDEKQGLRSFVEAVEGALPLNSNDVAYEWVCAMSKSYAEAVWSDDMKLAVVQMLNKHDSGLYERITRELDRMASSQAHEDRLQTVVPMLLELYIDIYERITNPSSVVDYATRMTTKDRMNRWLDIFAAFLQLADRDDDDPLSIRFLWASTMVSALVENPVREHILLMWTSLRDHMTKMEVDIIRLPNNVVMPIISPAAADREISKLTTMDFFLSLFQEEMESPVQVIETLEPVLNPSSVLVQSTESRSPQSQLSSEPDEELQQDGKPIFECASQGLRDLWKFLHGSSTELRLFLWSRLGDAYKAIDYETKQFSCYLRSIELIVADLAGETYAKTSDDSRKLLLMRTFKSLDELLIQALTMALNKPKAFDIIDPEHIKSSASAVAKVSCLLHVVSLCEDEILFEVIKTPSSNTTFQALLDKLREMQVRAWCLQFTLIKAAIPQQGSFISPDQDMADYLAAVHHVIGSRKFCKASNKIFLKIMRLEILRLKNLENWEDYFEQVLYDLHGLKLGSAWGVHEHDCPHEDLEKRHTMQLVDRVMILANRTPTKDLLKSDLKTTIDHMQTTIGQLRSTAQMLHNLRNFTEYLKKPVHPLRLYRALIGAVSVDAVSVNIPEAALAKHGWFFLLGMIALTKFKGVDLNRRQTPGATDDLRIGATFLRLQLQFTADRWDAWFRLAECFDYELDEAVLWSADKINKDRAELVKFQRNAIHCYTLALSHSQNVEVDPREGDALHDLYFKFGMRLYASSREPFAMEPFLHSDQERFFIEGHIGTYKRILHEQMPKYKVWKFAAKLFRMTLKRKPDSWKNSYMLAKCYWKMLQTPDAELDRKDLAAKISPYTVIDALKKSVEAAHKARKSRSSEPILEPHYKILAILCKMVESEHLPAGEAAQILSKQPLSVEINPDEGYAGFKGPEDFEEYAIINLGKLRDKDKSNWQHRIVLRHARLLYNESMFSSNEGYVEAKAAFGILRDSIFTKTMVMNVWKCDTERPGRHHVYTEQYTRYMVQLLITMNDRVNLEQLLRRIRKKGADFYHFNDLWSTCCMAYLNLLRNGYQVKTSVDEVFKAMSSEEFEIITGRITDWAARDGAEIPVVNCMRDAIELKKLNGSLIKAAPIDDLISDCYIQIYVDVAGTLPGLPPAKIIEDRKAAAAEATADEASKVAANPLTSLLNAALEGQDSRKGTPTPGDSEKPETSTKAPRKTYIRRPDILRKAEQAVSRSIEPVKPVKSRVNSVSSAKRGSLTPVARNSDEEDTEEEEGPDAQVRREAAEERDSGDEADESGSDLSDVPEDYDEEIPEGLMLARDSGDEADSESEGDEEDEEIGMETTVMADDEGGEDDEHEDLDGDTEMVEGEEHDEEDEEEESRL